MYICPNCNAQSEEAMNFCSKCGGRMVYVAPAAPVAPVAPAAPVEAPVAPVAAPAELETTVAAPAYAYDPTAHAAPVAPVAPAAPEAPVAPAAPVYNPAPTAAPTYYSAPVAPAAPAAKSSPLRIIAMACSIFGATSLFISLICIWGAMADSPYYFYYSYYEEICGTAIGLVFGFAPFAIAGLILANKSQQAGDASVFSRLGKIFGIVGIALAGTLFISGLIALGL